MIAIGTTAGLPRGDPARGRLRALPRRPGRGRPQARGGARRGGGAGPLPAGRAPLGETVRLGGDWYQVVGVLEGRASPRGRGAAIRGRDLNRSVLVPLPALDRGADRQADGVDEIVFRVATPEAVVPGGRRRAGRRPARDGRRGDRGDRAPRDPAPARAHPAGLQRGDRGRRRDQPAGGRDRDHEHHAGERRRADARGGRPPRPRGPPPGRGRAVPRRELAPHRRRGSPRQRARPRRLGAHPVSSPAGPPPSTR